MMKLLIFTDWYEPGYLAGGPIRSLQNLVGRLNSEMEIDVFTSNKDFSSSEPYDLPADQWVERNGVRVWYCSDHKYGSATIKKILSEEKYDRIYFNSLFSVRYTLRPLVMLKRLSYSSEQIILAPRGMLGRGALQLKKHKKRIFLWVSKHLGLFSGISWHATSEDEELQIRKHYGEKARVVQATNMPNPNLSDSPKEKHGGKWRLVFLSRISPKKNLKFVLECIARYSDQKYFRFDLYGTPEDKKYLKEILDLASQNDIDLEYHGSVPHNKVAETLRSGDLLVLPTLNENYGHVIFESLAVGTPVLISDQTPWRSLKEKKVGWDVPLDPPSWKKVLQEVIDTTEEDYREMSKASIAYAKEHLDSIDLSPYFRLFQSKKN